MNKTATVRFTAKGKSYSHSFPHNPNNYCEEMNAFLKANKISKKDVRDCQTTVSGWNFWVGCIF